MKPNLFNFAILMAGILTAGASQAQSYQFVDLGSGSATGINDLGQVVGYSSAGPMLWNGSNATVLAGGIYSYPEAINDSGVIVGAYTTFNVGVPSPIKWSGATTIALQTDMLGGAAYAINGAGQIVGNGVRTAVLWNRDSYIDLPLANDDWAGSATGINNAGQIVGYAAQIGGGGMQAVSWTAAGGNGTLLNTLGGSYSQATGINNAGEIIGQSTNALGTLYATEWNGNRVTQLQSLGGQYSYANGINDAGIVVGSSTTAKGQVLATMWDGVRIVNLNSYLTSAEQNAGWVLTDATGINQNGWIIGDAVNTRIGGSEAFELKVINAVPEADTWAMLLAGLALIGAFRYFKPTRFKQLPGGYQS